MTSFVHTHQRNHRIQLMMATVAIFWATMRAPLMVMVGSSSWLLVACWSSVVGCKKRKMGVDAGGGEIGEPECDVAEDHNQAEIDIGPS